LGRNMHHDFLTEGGMDIEGSGRGKHHTLFTEERNKPWQPVYWPFQLEK